MQMQARGSRMRPYWGSLHHHVQRANRASYPLDVYGIGYAQRGLWTLPHGLGCLSRATEGGEDPGHHSSIKQQRSALALTTHFGEHEVKPEILGLVRHNAYRPNSEDTTTPNSPCCTA
ncbi:Calmodulin [Fusarium oxysporum f. sp. albedinis]|nr:Calmodulin [Fusarium oxysporum f. sp. albedinis]